jgi:hypothetical protein
MQFSVTFSRDDLQAIPAKRRLEAIRSHIDHTLSMTVQQVAAAGKTSYLYVIPSTSGMPKSYPPAYVVTPDDLIEGLRVKFPGCDISHSEEWIDVRPGVREHRKGILIDWS